MAQMQKVSWRTVGYAALGSTAIIAAAVGIVHSDGVRPTSMKSSAATRWLVYQPDQLLVLADGLSGKVLAKIEAKSEETNEIAVQGAGGAFLVSPTLGTVRAVSTANLQLGTPQAVGALSLTTTRDELGVGTTGLTVVSTDPNAANIVAAGDVPRPISVPKSTGAIVARDGSMWLFTDTEAKHVGVDGSGDTFELRGKRDATTTIGADAVYLDHKAQMVHWLDGGEVPVDSIPNAADAVLQVRGDDAKCVWMATGDTLACIGKTSIDRVIHVEGLNVGGGDTLAVAGTTAAVVHAGTNIIERIDLETGTLLPSEGGPSGVPVGAQLTITAVNGMIWIDDEKGSLAWVIQQFGVQVIHKNDTAAPTVNAQGEITNPGSGTEADTAGAGNAPGDDTEQKPLDHNGVENPPVAVDDSVTARAGATVTIPVTANDYDPDDEAIAVVSVGDTLQAGHGTVDLLDGTSVTYVPYPGFSGSDAFDYTIVDEFGNHATAKVNLQLFPPDSPNRAPIATADRVQTRVGHPVTIDVLANDIDPERDALTIPTFGQNGSAKITDTTGPTGLPALKYFPPDTPSVYTFTYQAADPQGGTSAKTLVTVDVVGDDAPNGAPDANPDAIRLAVGKTATVDVKANDVDPDGDDLFIRALSPPTGISVALRGQELDITLQPGAPDLSVVQYGLNDGSDLPEVIGHVLVVKIDDNAPNRPPVANPDTERVVVGNSVKIAVTGNDADPEGDPIRLLSVAQPDGGVGTTSVEGNSNFVRFTPNLPNITEPTPVTFTYKIGDGHGNTATGTVTITVLVDPLPRAPFARDDFADTFTDKPVNINVLANDSDPSGGKPQLSGNPVCTNGGEAITNADEGVTFDPPQGQNGTFRCKYRVANSQGLPAEAWIIVTVTTPAAGNHDPTLIDGTANQTVEFGASLNLDVNTFATDVDGDSLVFASMSKQGAGSANFTQNTQSFRYTAPLAGSADAIPSVVNLDVTISDGHDNYVRDTISIKLTAPAAAAAPPLLAHDIPRSTTLDLAVPPIDVPAELREQNPGVTLSLQSASADSGSAPASIERAGGMVRITPQAVGVISITYVVANSDDLTQTATGKIIVTVTEPIPVDPPPVAVDDSLTVSSGGSDSVDLLINDLGIADQGDKPSATLANRPPASFGTVQLTNGILTLTAAPDVVEKHATITYNLSDGSGSPSVQGSVKLNILACADSAPVAISGSVFTPYMTPINIDLNQYAPSGHVVPNSVSGAGLTGPTGTYTPPAGKSDNEVVTFVVENGCHQAANGVLTIDVNRPPVANSVDKKLSQGDSLTLVATDLATDDETLMISAITGNPGWVSLAAGVINASPTASTPATSYSFTATVQDPGGLSAVATIKLTINNLPPTAVPDVYTTDKSVYTLDPDPRQNDTDPEHGPLGIQVITPVDPSDQVSVDGNQITVSIGHGVSKFNYTIFDSGGLTDSSTITVTSNRPPTGDNTESVNTDQPTDFVFLSPIDPDADELTTECMPNGVFAIDVINDPAPDVPGRVRVHFDFGEWTGSTVVTCFSTDTFGADVQSQISIFVS
jgi:Bacterial Ig domain